MPSNQTVITPDLMGNTDADIEQIMPRPMNVTPLFDGSQRSIISMIPTMGKGGPQSVAQTVLTPVATVAKIPVNAVQASDVPASIAPVSTQASFDLPWADEYGGPTLEITPSSTLEIPQAADTSTLEIPSVYAADDTAAYAAEGTGVALAQSLEWIPIIGQIIGVALLIYDIATNPSSFTNLHSSWYNIPGTQIGLGGLVNAVSGVPKLQKSMAVAGNLAGVTNPALSAYFTLVQRAIRAGVPLSVSSGPWRAALDAAASQAIRSLEAEGYPPQLAAQLFTQLIDGKIHQIPNTYAQWMVSHPNYKTKGGTSNGKPANKPRGIARPSNQTRPVRDKHHATNRG